MKMLSIATVAVAAALFLGPVRAQQPPAHEHQKSTPQAGMMDHDKMMAEIKAADARLESLAQKMKAAKNEDEKVRAMEDVVAELVQGQLTMHRHMSTMHEHMMSEMQRKK